MVIVGDFPLLLRFVSQQSEFAFFSASTLVDALFYLRRTHLVGKIIIRWKSAFFGSACKFDVYLMNTYIGELKYGWTLKIPVKAGVYILSFKQKSKFGKKADTAFEVVVNEESEVVELRTKFDMNGNFVVKYADNAPHIPMHSNATRLNTQQQINNVNNNPDKYPNSQKNKSGCLSGCLTFIIIIIAIHLIFAVIFINNSNPDNTTTTTQVEQAENVLYSDDNFKITFIDFTDPKLGITSYSLRLKIENNSNKTVIVAPSDGYANDEAVFLGSGLPVKIKPNKKATGAFVVGYGNTSIKNIDEIKTLELKITLYDENFSEKILTTGNLLINLG